MYIYCSVKGQKGQERLNLEYHAPFQWLQGEPVAGCH